MLSAIIITYNEEKNLPECLESLQGLVDEIVIVDRGSDDKTEEIAKQYGARFFQTTTWQGFGVQKNLALSYARHPWILSIDADERISPELKDEIKITLRDPQHQAYRFLYTNYFLGKKMKYGPFKPNWMLRLFLKEHANFFNYYVHEHVRFSGQTGKLHHLLIHHPYRSQEDIRRKKLRYIRSGAVRMQQEGKKTFPMQAVLKAGWAWFRLFILNLGFLEGQVGWKASAMITFTTYGKYALLRNLEKRLKYQTACES